VSRHSRSQGMITLTSNYNDLCDIFVGCDKNMEENMHVQPGEKKNSSRIYPIHKKRTVLVTPPSSRLVSPHMGQDENGPLINFNSVLLKRHNPPEDINNVDNKDVLSNNIPFTPPDSLPITDLESKNNSSSIEFQDKLRKIHGSENNYDYDKNPTLNTRIVTPPTTGFIESEQIPSMIVSNNCESVKMQLYDGSYTKHYSTVRHQAKAQNYYGANEKGLWSVIVGIMLDICELCV